MQAVHSADLSFEIWRLLTFKNTNLDPSPHVRAIGAYSHFFIPSVHAHWIAVVMAIYRLFDSDATAVSPSGVSDTVGRCHGSGARRHRASLRLPAGFYLGEFSSSIDHAEKAREVVALRPEAWARSIHLGTLWQSGRSLWFLGFHERALARCRDSFTAAQRDFNPFSLAVTTGALAEVHGYGGELRAMKEQLEAHLAANDQYGLAAVIPGREKILDGWCRVAQGEAESGIAMIHQGIELNSTNHYRVNSAFYASLLAKASALTGRTPEGLQILDQALSQVEQSGERFYEAELFRLKGEFLNSSNADPCSVETCFRRAIKVAQAQCAKALELRATSGAPVDRSRAGKDPAKWA